MTVPPPDSTSAEPGATPPPGCPAHAHFGDGGTARVHGAEHAADPMGLYERLRAEHGPVAPVLVDGDLPAWMVLGYRENLDVARTPSRFSRDSRRWTYFKNGQAPADSPMMPMIGWQPLCVFTDGEEHERLRLAVTESLARIDRRGIRRAVTRFSELLINEFVKDGRADLVDRFTEHVPMLVMTQLYGMPDEYGPRLVEASRDLIKGTPTAYASNEYVMETLRELVDRKRANPTEDFPSWLMSHPSRLTDEEVAQHLRLVLIAANENTTNLMTNTLRMVLSDPRFRASLAGIRMTLPDAVEQILWDEPPLMVCPARWATGDTELAGQHIKAGDMLLLGLAAGNTDPVIRPDLSAPLYGNRSHLAFSGGPHECPGQDIGRAMTETAIDVLLSRLPDAEIEVPDEELRYVSSWMSRHLVELPVVFTPRETVPDPEAEDAEPEAVVLPRPRREPAPEAATAGPEVRGWAVSPPRSRPSWWATITGRLKMRR